MKRLIFILGLIVSLFANGQGVHNNLFGTRTIFTTEGLGYVDSTHQIGTIFDSSAFVTIGTGAYIQTSASGASVSGGRIILTEGDNTRANFVRLPNPTCLDNQIFTVKYRITSLNAADSGLQIAFKSSNTHQVADLYAYLNTTTKHVLLRSNASGGNQYSLSAATLPSITAGDSLQITLYNNYQTLTATATNITTGNSISTTFANTFVFGAQIMLSNTAQVTIFSGFGTYEIDRWIYSSNLPKGARVTIAGYSITQGAYAGSIINAWPRQVGSVVTAGSGDYTATLLTRLNDLYLINSPNVIIGGLAGNDVLYGISSGTWQANLVAIYDSLTAHGMNVYFTLETPRQTTDITPVNTFIIATWPGRYIDLFTTLWSGASFTPIANSLVDGTHPNAIAHDMLAYTVDTSTVWNAIFAGVSRQGEFYSNGQPNLNLTNDLGWIDYRHLTDALRTHVFPSANFQAGGPFQVLYGDPLLGRAVSSTSWQFNPSTLMQTITGAGTGGTGPSLTLYNTSSTAFTWSSIHFFNNAGTVVGTNGLDFDFYSTTSGAHTANSLWMNMYQGGDLVWAVTNVPKITLLNSGELNIGSSTSTPTASSLLTVNSTTKGTIPAPVMTLAQFTAISSKATGLLATLSDSSNKLCYFDGAAIHRYVTGDELAVFNSGTYLPVTTGFSNVASTTGDTALWTKNKSIVDVSGSLSVSATLGTSNVQINVPLPINSALSAGHACWGNATSAQTTNGFLAGVISGGAPGSQTAIITVGAPGLTSSFIVFYHFKYQIQ